MKLVDLEGISYIGGDIVKDLIAKNNKAYKNATREFRYINAATDDLPTSDLIFCRDLLVHLSLEDAHKILKNFKKSGSKYLLVTTHLTPTKNRDIKMGRWRKLNLEKAPFNFPKPLMLIFEKSPEKSECDKYLGLWKLNDLFKAIGTA